MTPSQRTPHTSTHPDKLWPGTDCQPTRTGQLPGACNNYCEAGQQVITHSPAGHANPSWSLLIIGLLLWFGRDTTYQPPDMTTAIWGCVISRISQLRCNGSSVLSSEFCHNYAAATLTRNHSINGRPRFCHPEFLVQGRVLPPSPWLPLTTGPG